MDDFVQGYLFHIPADWFCIRKIKLFVRILLFQLMTHTNFRTDNEFPGGAAGSLFENPGGGTDIISHLKYLGIAFRMGQYQGIGMYFL